MGYQPPAISRYSNRALAAYPSLLSRARIRAATSTAGNDFAASAINSAARSNATWTSPVTFATLLQCLTILLEQVAQEIKQHAGVEPTLGNQTPTTLLGHGDKSLLQILYVEIGEMHVPKLHAAYLLKLFLHTTAHQQCVFQTQSISRHTATSPSVPFNRLARGSFTHGLG